MEMNRKGSQIVLELDKEESAMGLFAVLSGRQDLVTPEVFKHGQEIYTWFFGSVQRLATNYSKEKSVSTMTGEVLSGPPLLPKKARKR